jgi:hypothetical protein
VVCSEEYRSVVRGVATIVDTMVTTQTRHQDVIIQRRFGQSKSTGAVTQRYAITYPGHSDLGSEHEIFAEAEQMAIALGRERKVTVWFEETPQSGKRTLLEDFRSADVAPTGTIAPSMAGTSGPRSAARTPRAPL